MIMDWKGRLPVAAVAALTCTAALVQAQWTAFSVASPDGMVVPAVWQLPAGEGPFPAVIYLHGAPGGRGAAGIDSIATGAVTSQRWQALLDNGIAVCIADWRGHPANDPGAALDGPVNATDDLQAVLAHLESQPSVDAARIGFIGDSMGGLIILLTFEDRPLGPANLNYAAIVVNNYFSYFGPPFAAGCTGTIADNQMDVPGTLARLDSVDQPVLIEVGLDDGLCPYNHKLHELLLRLGRASTLHDFAGSGHGFLNGPDNANFQQALANTVAFFGTHLSGSAGAPACITGLQGAHTSGQTFLTWNECTGAGNRYRIYRKTQPMTSVADLATAVFLGEVDDRTSENLRQTELAGSTQFFRITDLGAPLAAAQGLFVDTVDAAADYYYAVTSVVGGSEETTITPGANAMSAPVACSVAMPRPVLQSTSGTGGNTRHYVHWVSDRSTPLIPAMWNQPSRAFNFRVIYSTGFPDPRPLMAKFHARGNNYQQPAEASHPEAVIFAPDDWIGQSPTNTFWYGLSPGFPAAPDGSTPVADYTVRRVIAEIDWVQANFPCDSERVYASGGSMGGIGSVFFAYRFPERFAAVHTTIPKFDFGCQDNGCWIEPSAGDQMWGTPEQNFPCTDGVGVFDRLDIGFLAQQDLSVDYPLVTAWNGRSDTVVGWPEKPPTYAALQAARQPAVFLFDQRDHQGAGGVWSAFNNTLRNEIWNYRIHQAIPAFSNLSLNDDPGDGNPLNGDAVGTINGYLSWDTSTIQDTAAHHSLLCRLRTTTGLENAPAPTATVDWTPRRLQMFPRVAGDRYRFVNLQEPGALEVEDRPVVADSFGQITVAGAIITKNGNTFRLEVILACDLNCDLQINQADVPLFVTALIDPAGFTGCDITRADMNQDGPVDGRDIQPFVASILTP